MHTAVSLGLLFPLVVAFGCSREPSASVATEPRASGQPTHAAGASSASEAPSSGALASASSSAQPSANGLPDGDPALARRLVGEGALLIDVRTPTEFADRHLDKAVNVPVEELAQRLADVEKLAAGDKDKPIVVYCKSGGRAGRAKAMLVKAGFTRITNLGTIDDWNRE